MQFETPAELRSCKDPQAVERSLDVYVMCIGVSLELSFLFFFYKEGFNDVPYVLSNNSGCVAL